MSKITITQIPDEDVNYRFDDWVDFDGLYKDKMVITGNRDFSDLGDKALVKIIKGDYYDDDDTEVVADDGTVSEETIGYDYETVAELEKVSGKKGWNKTTIRGYSQGDWNEVWYVESEVTDKEIKYIEDFYMGKISEFHVEDDGDDYYDYVPHDVVWKGKQEICDYLGFKNYDEVEVYNDKGELID